MKNYNQEKKADAGKPMLNLIPPSTIKSLGKVLTYGAEKYGDNTWQTVDNAEKRYQAALLRHFYEYMENPHSKDKESGLLHIEHVLCNAAFLNHFQTKKKNNTDFLKDTPFVATLYSFLKDL